jgi:uncharacterized protein (TIGR03000 family)
MYTAVLMLALTSGTESADFGRRGGGCNGGCAGYYGGCSGSYHGGCHGGCSGGYYRSGYYAPNGYSYSGPTYYYSDGRAYYSSGPGMDARQSFYYSPSDGGTLIRVILPNPDAEVWFDGAATQQRGFERAFNTPVLESGNYTYKIKAKWMDNGRAVEQERKVQFQPGQPVMVDFRTNQGEEIRSPKTPDSKDTLPKPLPRDKDLKKTPNDRPNDRPPNDR